VKTPDQLLKSVYLGDRACRGLRLDTVNKRFEVVVDLISRIRSADGLWNYYSEEDIPDGRLVFENVSAVSLEPPGPLPNDYILGISVEQQEDRFVFKIRVASVEAEGSCEVTITIHASEFYLSDPRTPDARIRD